MSDKAPQRRADRRQAFRAWPPARVGVDIALQDTRDGCAKDRAPRALVDLLIVRDLDTLVDREALLRGTTDTEPPYWTRPWLGARAIAGLLSAWPPPAGSRVLDLGCGLGLAGVAAAAAGAHVFFVDANADALAFADANARLHGLKAYRVQQLDFTRERLDQRFNWILAADIVYDPRHYRALASFLDEHLTESGVVLLTESLRADASVVIELLRGRRIAGPCRALWLREEDRPERTWLHLLGRLREVPATGWFDTLGRFSAHRLAPHGCVPAIPATNTQPESGPAVRPA